ncbi:ORF_087L [Scale drop disease virus]|nr:ORF_087L [Scale drop disease virus]AKU37502.1 ORF_087L [Scale drop disease virus]
MAYIGGRQMSVLKWKSVKQNTIDFCLKQTGETTADLIVSNGKVFATMSHSDSLTEYHGKIVECTYCDNKWSIVRVRDDKHYANSMFTCLRIYDSILNPIDFDLLIDTIEYSFADVKI